MKVVFNKEQDFELISDEVSDPSLCNCRECLEARKIARLSSVNKSKNLGRKRGLIILENDPCVRTIFTAGNKNSQRLNFPYIQFAISYIKNGENSFYYSGIYGLGLRVFFSTKPLSSFDEAEIFYADTDRHRFGLICTPHENDNKEFKSLEQLVDFVVAMYWGIRHAISPEWANLTAEEVMQEDVLRLIGKSPLLSMRTALENSFDLVGQGLIRIARKETFYPEITDSVLNQEWPIRPDPPVVTALKFLQQAMNK